MFETSQCKGLALLVSSEKSCTNDATVCWKVKNKINKFIKARQHTARSSTTADSYLVMLTAEDGKERRHTSQFSYSMSKQSMAFSQTML